MKISRTTASLLIEQLERAQQMTDQYDLSLDWQVCQAVYGLSEFAKKHDDFPLIVVPKQDQD